MSKFVLTVYEPTIEQAAGVVREAPAFIDALEIRLDMLDQPIASLRALRSATSKELILTRRNAPFSVAEIEEAFEIGFNWVDLELSDQVQTDRFSERTILSHHDFESASDVDALYRRMKAIPAAKRKIALTPRAFADNEKLLAMLTRANDPRLTVIGMGSRGLYSRILAPFFGSELIFIARDEKSIAAPSQLTIEKARAIYGDAPKRPTAIFAVVGNPVGHSRSPEIHNPRFREEKVSAVYSMIETASFEEVGEAMVERRPFAPAGVSITAPFKEEAYEFARRRNARITPQAAECRAVNTFVVFRDGAIADNTDVAGFAAALQAAGKLESAALIGAGGAARAALLALRRTARRITIFNRTGEHAEKLAAQFDAAWAPLEKLGDFRGEVIVNSLPASANVDFPLLSGGTYIDVSYADGAEHRIARARQAGMRVFDGIDFLKAQAVPQNELFLRAAREAQ